MDVALGVDLGAHSVPPRSKNWIVRSLRSSGLVQPCSPARCCAPMARRSLASGQLVLGRNGQIERELALAEISSRGTLSLSQTNGG